MAFLPMSLKEAGKAEVDFVLVSADAYVDHPSFACAAVGRWLEFLGYSVGIIAQPDFKTAESFKVFGKPNLAFLVCPGNLDSMVNIYTVSGHKRREDLYSPGGKTGLRPKRACIVYTNRIREAFGSVPVIIGGIEASLRRFAHYDYWDDKVRQSVLADSGADMLVYGMGEKPLTEIAEALASGLNIRDITYVRGTCFTAKDLSAVYDCAETPSLGEIRESREKYCNAFCTQMDEREKCVAQMQQDVYVVQNPPAEKLTVFETDEIYALPYERRAHPSYKAPVPALEEVKFSITSQRGCIGGCSFCSLYYHQGKNIERRSRESIVKEAKSFISDKDFKGYISDVGGPTANFYGAGCKNKNGPCVKRRCLTPKKCPNLVVEHESYLELLRALRSLKGVKKVFVRSGVRFDYALLDNGGFIRELAKYHVSGQLRLAPEHISPSVLRIMGKPDIEIYERFKNRFESISRGLRLKQYVLPYFMSSHPGCTLADAVALAEYMHKNGLTPKQAQDFYPTPGTLSTCMYYTGMEPYTRKKVYVPRSKEEKELQRALLQYSLPQNRAAVISALKKAGREDLIGNEKRCLVRNY